MIGGGKIVTYTIDPTSTEIQKIGAIPQCIIDYYNLQCISAEVHLPPVCSNIKKNVATGMIFYNTTKLFHK